MWLMFVVCGKFGLDGCPRWWQAQSVLIPKYPYSKKHSSVDTPKNDLDDAIPQVWVITSIRNQKQD